MIPPFPQFDHPIQQIAVDGGYVAHWCRHANWGQNWQPDPLGSRILHVAAKLRKGFPSAHILWAWDNIAWLEKENRIPRLNAALEAFGVAAFYMGGAKADDLIGSCQISPPGFILTPDKDIHSLVKEQLPAISLGKQGWQMHTVQALREQWGVEPARIPEVLAWCGDKSDGIKGIPGISREYAARITRAIGLPLREVNFDEPRYAKLAPYADQVMDNYYAIRPCTTLLLSWKPVPVQSAHTRMDKCLSNGFSEMALLSLLT